MPTATRTFRVFVSSTFEDLKEERNALQREVFPKLEKLCEAHGAQFQAIDLRWGVRDEAAVDQRTMEICLTEIERCQKTGIKPNFIVLLGDRYGWRPLQSRIEAVEFEKVRGRIADADQALVKDWYQRDDNAVPPEYLLKPRAGEFVDATAWAAVEQRLHQTLREAAHDASLPEEAMVKYEASATHQETLKGLGTTPEDRKHVFAFFRSSEGASEDPDLAKLKRTLHEQLGRTAVEYKAGDIQKLCRNVAVRLKRVIRREVRSFESRSALELEVEAHDTFARDRARHFIGRKSVLRAIGDYVRGDDRRHRRRHDRRHRQPSDARPLVVHGASGSGKSAVMAKASSGAGVIRRFLGATPESSSGITLLRGLCQQMGATEIPVEFISVVRTFQERLSLATAERPLVLFIDALDQLTENDPAKSLTWLPSELPPHCRIVVSSSDVPNAVAGGSLVELEALLAEEANDALELWLGDARRTLQPDQRAKLLASFRRCGLPLYLKLAFEEARRWRSFDAMAECALEEGLTGIIDVLLDRLSEGANHGPMLVNRGLGFLAAARYGLAESEMLDMLSSDDQVWRDFSERAKHTPPEHCLPVIVWSRLYLDLEPYLAERAVPGGTVVTFYHRQLTERVAVRYLAESDAGARHGDLARYFDGQSHWLGEAWRPNARKAVELVYQQLGADLIEEALSALTDLGFVAAKCATGLVLDLQKDYRDTITVHPEGRADIEEERRRDARMAKYGRDLIAFSKGEIQHLEVPESLEPWSEERIKEDARRIQENPTRLDRVRAFTGFVKRESYPLLEFGARAGFVVQHAYNNSPRGPVHAAAAQQINAIGVPLLLNCWPTGEEYHSRPAVLRTLEGHTASINCAAITADGHLAVSGSSDGTLKLWNLMDGACLRTLEVSAEFIESIALTANGRRVVTATPRLYSNGSVLSLWDMQSGACLGALDAHTKDVLSLAVTADGRWSLSGSADCTLKLWGLETGVCLRTFEGHSHAVVSTAFTPDGRRAVSGSLDNTVKLWDLEAGVCLRTLKEYTPSCRPVALTADARRVLSGSFDNTLGFWDLETGTCLRKLWGHKDEIAFAAVSADGLRALSAAHDGQLKLWDLRTGACLRTLALARDECLLAMTADGRQAISSSGNDLKLWDLETGSWMDTVKAHTNSISSLAVTTDGGRVLSGSYDNTLKLWDLKTTALLRTFLGHITHARTGPRLHTLEEDTGSVTSMALTPDGRFALSGASDFTVKIWDLNTGACLETLAGHLGPIDAVAATPDGRQVLSSSDDCTMKLWDIESATCLRTLEQPHNVLSIALMSGGRRLISGGRDGTLKLWDIETGACLHNLEGHTSAVKSIALTLNGRAVSSSYDGTLKVWDLETASCLWTLKGHTGDVLSTAVTEDGRRAVSGSRDKTLRLWDLASGQCLGTVRLVAACTSVALSAALNRVVAGTSNGEVFIFDVHGLTLNPQVVPVTAHEPRHSQLRREIAACGELWGDAHPNTLLGRLALGIMLEDASEQADARTIYRNIGEICRELAVESPGIREVIARLVPRLARIGEFELAAALTEDPENLSSSPQYSLRARVRVDTVSSTPHPLADPEGAAQRNMRYRSELALWRALPWWKRLLAKRPEPPTGVLA